MGEIHGFRAAVAAGVMILIDSDAHRTSTLANMRWGVATARRAWLTREDVVNTRPWAELRRRRSPGCAGCANVVGPAGAVQMVAH